MQVQQPPSDALGDGQVEGLDQLVRQPTHLSGHHRRQGAVEVGIPLPEPFEGVGTDHHRLGALDRPHRGQTGAGRDQRQLTEVPPRPDHAQRRDVALRSGDPDEHMARRHQVDCVSRVALVEDDLAPGELPTTRLPDEDLTVRLPQRGQQLPVRISHAPSLPDPQA